MNDFLLEFGSCFGWLSVIYLWMVLWNSFLVGDSVRFIGVGCYYVDVVEDEDQLVDGCDGDCFVVEHCVVEQCDVWCEVGD